MQENIKNLTKLKYIRNGVFFWGGGIVTINGSIALQMFNCRK